MRASPQPADVELRVRRIAEGGDAATYHLAATTRHFPGQTLDFGSFHLTAAARADVLTRVRLMARFTPSPGAMAGVPAAIADLGHLLWDLLPAGFRAFHGAHLRGRELSILVRTDDLGFPWEMVLPRGAPGGLSDLFGLAFAIGRWPAWLDRDPPSLAVAGALVAVTGAGSDSCNGAEADFLGSPAAAGLGLVRHVSPASFAGLATAVARGPVRVLHVRTHGSLTSAGPTMEFVDGAIGLGDVSSLATGNLQRSLVYLNACQGATRAQTASPTHPAGWGAAFAAAGCAATVAPLWPVSQGGATTVVRRFYERLLAGETVGEALRWVRRCFPTPEAGVLTTDGGPCRWGCHLRSTCLAFVVFGHPNARLAATVCG